MWHAGAQVAFVKSYTLALALPLTQAPMVEGAHTYPESRVLLVVAGKVKDALGGHGQPCVLR